MSILVIGGGELMEVLVERLVSEGDDVRVLGDDATQNERLHSLGAHVARGPLDSDLIERAGQNVRTVVVLEPFPGIDEIIAGASMAGIGRAVACGAEIPPEIADALRRSGLDYVCLSTGSRPRPFRKSLAAGAVAEAIDAADDLAGNPKLDLNLTRDDAWGSLKLQAPR